jgi:hypothetical protein
MILPHFVLLRKKIGIAVICVLVLSPQVVRADEPALRVDSRARKGWNATRWRSRVRWDLGVALRQTPTTTCEQGLAPERRFRLVDREVVVGARPIRAAGEFVAKSE